MSLEKFKEVEGFPNYEISTWGRVFNKRIGRFQTPYHHHKGYLRVDLVNEDGRKHFKVHRLVATAFIPNPDGKPQVNHIDGNPANNSVTNLEWVTNRENKDKAQELRAEIKRLQMLVDEIDEDDE